MKKEKRTKFIKASTGREFEAVMNESLKGLMNPQVEIFGKYEGCIIYEEFVYVEEEKSIADLFEEAGCGATCSECPLYKESKDGRVKWTVCEQEHRRINKESRACDSFYLGRRKDVPSIGEEAEGKELEDHGLGRMPQDLSMEGLLQEEWKDSVLAIGERGACQGDGSSCGRVIQGGLKC